jgi:hypothetical protein
MGQGAQDNESAVEQAKDGKQYSFSILILLSRHVLTSYIRANLRLHPWSIQEHNRLRHPYQGQGDSFRLEGADTWFDEPIG